MSTHGKPGEKGFDAVGSVGGAGGAGGEGGRGEHLGGAGGTGGTGGRGETGPVGPRGKNAPHRAVIGYAILMLFVLIGFARGEQIDNKVCSYSEADRQIIRTILIDANRRTQTSDQRTKEEKETAAKYYAETLAKIPPVKC